MEEQKTFQEQLAALAAKFKGDRNGILARRVNTTTETVRRTFKSTAQSFSELTPMQQKVVQEAVSYLEDCNMAQKRIMNVMQ